MENGFYDSSSVNWSSFSDNDFEDIFGCKEETVNAMVMVWLAISTIAIAFTTTTLLLIVCHRRLRRKHNIFPFNIVLADCVFDLVTLANFLVIKGGIWFHKLDDVLAVCIIALQMISTESILLVAADQLIAFKLDPFDVRNILTKLRRILICIITWIFTALILAFVCELSSEPMMTSYLRSYAGPVLVLLTSVCYFVAYKSISRATLSGEHQLQARRRENKRVLRTFAVVLGTNIVLCTLPDLIPFVAYSEKLYFPYCVNMGLRFMKTLNTIANSFIYWWRLREFRSIFSCCRVGQSKVHAEGTNMSKL